ncbi:MAG: glycoside hydrolase family 125 protein [Flavisolibacter sp.]
MNRKQFISQSSLGFAGLMLSKYNIIQSDFPVVRIPLSQRKFTSEAVESVIAEIQKNIGNKKLAWMFGNCFPNTLDTTVDFEMTNGKPDTYVITGDINAMWLRDSTAQITPYIFLAHKDRKLQQLIQGVINRQVYCIHKDPYANAFYKDDKKTSPWKDRDKTEMKPGIHERKWEIDSLCYPIRLSYLYWKETNDLTPFDNEWVSAMQLILKTFKEQQRWDGKSPYTFQRTTSWATDGVTMGGMGYPVKPNGLICSTFRPSDDATVFSYLIPSNFFAVVACRQVSELLVTLRHNDLAKQFSDLAGQVYKAIRDNAIINVPRFGKIYAYEINGFGSYNLMDDTNVPSLLSLPYIGAVPYNDPIYVNTRKFVFSDANPFYTTSRWGESITSPHCGLDMLWQLSIIVRGLTSKSNEEIKLCLKQLQDTDANTGFIHETFHREIPEKFTRKWFAWANTIFGEFVWKVYKHEKALLD